MLVFIFTISGCGFKGDPKWIDEKPEKTQTIFDIANDDWLNKILILYLNDKINP